MRGDGRVFQRGNVWWAAWYDGQGRERRAPGGATQKAAERVLRQRLAEVRTHIATTPEQDRLTISGLLDVLDTHLENKGIRSLRKTRLHLKPLRNEIGAVLAKELTTAAVEGYTRGRLDRGLARATVNRELEGLRQAFRLAFMRRPQLVRQVPLIPMLNVDNVRQGFLGVADFEALLEHITDPDVRDFIAWFWNTGMRPNEIRQLTWDMVDTDAAVLRLDPKAAKIGKGRAVPLVGPLREIMERRRAARRLDTPLIFHRTSKGKPGKPILDFSKQWRAALAAAGLPGTFLPYDLRRSAVRNLVRAGVPERVAMTISGHRTRSTFDRYNISSTEDVAAALVQTAAFLASQPRTRKVATMPKAANGWGFSPPASVRVLSVFGLQRGAKPGKSRGGRAGVTSDG